MKVLLTGCNGQLGNAILRSKPQKINLISLDRSKLDLSNLSECRNIIREIKPDWLINCAAFTNVDGAEKNKNLTYCINAEAPKIFCEEISKIKGNLLQISTDFVFNGYQRNQPYLPSDKRSPLGFYGYSKSKAEEIVEDAFKDSKKGIILRTSWLMGPLGENFALTMIKLHSQKEIIKVVADQVGSPTSTLGLAKVCWEIVLKNNNKLLINKNEPPILHWCDNGIASWYDLAVAIGEIGLDIGIINKSAKVIPIKTSEYKTIAKRPAYSVLDSSFTRKQLSIDGIHWRKSLEIVLREIQS